jgi:hypothetical protein
MSEQNESLEESAPSVVPPETAEARARRRASSMGTWFVLFLIMGLAGAAALGYFGSERTTVSSGYFGTFDTATTHNVTVGWTLFISGTIATLLTTLPLLGIQFLLEGQAEILKGQEPASSS